MRSSGDNLRPVERTFVYVAVLILHSHDKRVAGESRHLNQPLTLEPLEQALFSVVHHSDQGVQYLSNAYITTLSQIL